MQYILTEEEYNSLLNANKQYKEDHREMVQKLCSMVADEHAGYCDECPVKKERPCERKRFGKLMFKSIKEWWRQFKCNRLDSHEYIRHGDHNILKCKHCGSYQGGPLYG